MNKLHFIFLRSIVGNDPTFKDQERDTFLAKLNEDNDFIIGDSGEDIFFIETGGTEEQFKRVYSSYKEPYYILATNANNSLPAALEIATFLKKNNKKFHIFHGNPEEIKKQLKYDEFKKISKKTGGFLKFNQLKKKRFGVVGKPSDWLIASDVNYQKAYDKFGVSLIDIPTEEFLNEITCSCEMDVPEKFKKLLNKKIDLETLMGALKIYKALKSLIEKYNLDGLTVRCFDLLDSVKNTSCLALAMLNEEGYIATCEGDVPTMLSMAIVKKAFGQSSFQVNPSYINLEKQYAYFAHCTLPLDMCDSFSFDTHFESGIGIGIKGKLKLEDVTIFKMNSNLEDFEIFEGSIIENLNKNNLCRTQIKVSFNEDINDMFLSPNGNHLVIFYGAHKKELVKILSY